MTEISIVVPCYNVPDRLLRRCLDSIEKQEYKDYEIILIDDGSEKEFAKELNSLRKDYKKLRIIRQNNKGVSAARNTGIDLAVGKYLAFVDADDMLSPIFLKEALSIAKEEKADMVIGGIIDFSITEEFEISSRETFNIKRYSDKDIKSLKKYMLGTKKYSFRDGKIGQGPWARLIEATLCKKLKFDSTLAIGEDVLWNLQVLEKAKKVCLVENVWYGYFLNPVSSSRRFRVNAIAESVSSLRKIRDYIDFKNDEEYASYCRRCCGDLRRIYKCFISYCYNNCSMREIHKVVFKIYDKEPWEKKKEKRFSKLCTLKERLFCAFYRYHFLFLYYRVKDIGMRLIKKRK